jgi:hypothetical protein
MEKGIRNNTGKPQEADRYNSGKERWSLVDYEALKPMVHVLAFGAKKYSDDNWRKGLKTKEVCESLLRHITAYLSGQDNDQESGLPEVGHILCNAMFLSHMHLFRPDMDTRIKPEKVCCGKWDEYGKCTCESGEIKEEDSKGGLLDRFNEVAEYFCRKSFEGIEPPKKGQPASMYPRSVVDDIILWTARHKRAQEQNANIGRVYPKQADSQ